ncbi:MAG: hypothetical protein QW128_01855 [Thermoprotei archaeon]
MKTNKKITSQILTTLLILITILPALSTTLSKIPVPVYASTGAPLLGVVNNTSSFPSLTISNVTIASFNVSLKLDSITADKVDNKPLTKAKYFAIIFYRNTSLVTFSGAQFSLVISKDGYSQLSSDDKVYAGPFNVADLNTNKTIIVNTPLGSEKFYTYYGTVSGTTYKLLIGPISIFVSKDYKYIKIFDGSSTSVAVSAQIVDILSTLFITPSKGGAGTPVTVKGVAFPPNSIIELNYTSPDAIKGRIAYVTTNSSGMFTYGPFPIADLKGKFVSNSTTVPSDSITIGANGTMATVPFTEYQRAFVKFRSWDQTMTRQIDSATTPYYGNGTVTHLKALVFGKIVVSGKYFYANSPVKLYVGTTLLASANTNGTGFFNVTFTVPELPSGPAMVKVLDGNNVLYYFNLTILPTLILSPYKGPVGTTVTATAYGFPANSAIYLYWENVTYGTLEYKWLFNATTGANGKFNVTVTFTVPHTYGGPHSVNATSSYQGTNSTTLTGVIASAVFTVTPKLKIMSDGLSNTGAVHTIAGSGLDPTVKFALLVDNSLMNVVKANGTGDLLVPFTDAGFRPGLHVVSVMDWNVTGSPSFFANATFWVTPSGDVIYGSLVDILAQLSSANAVLTSVAGDVATVKTNVGAISVKVDNLMALLSKVNATVTSVAGDVATIKTDVGTIKANVNDLMALLSSVNATVTSVAGDVGSVKGTVATINTRVGTIMSTVNDVAFLLNAVNAKVVSIDGSVATIKTDVGTIKATLPALNASIVAVGNNVVAIKTSVGTIQGTVTDVKNGVATIQTDVGTIKADVSSIKGGVSGLKTSVDNVGSVASGVSSTAQTTMWLVVITFLVSLVSLVFIFRRR